jgi:hypothetical protein
MHRVLSRQKYPLRAEGGEALFLTGLPEFVIFPAKRNWILSRDNITPAYGWEERPTKHYDKGC